MATIDNQQFFEGPAEHSALKTRLVTEYFAVWTKVILGTAKRNNYQPRLGYVDLFCGPGRYSNGHPSTPLLILEQAIKDPALRRTLLTHFNDKDIHNVNALRSEISMLSGITSLKYEPTITNQELDKDFSAVLLDNPKIPTLLFADPFGYKGLSLSLIKSIVGGWGCDCIFFFNYNRIRAGVANPSVKDHMLAIFGDAELNLLQQSLSGKTSTEAEATVLEYLAEALKRQNIPYVLPFTFKSAAGNRTSHHVIFASKSFKGYEIMKDIMAKESLDRVTGVPSFEYVPATDQLPLLFELHSPLSDLQDQLISTFGGRTLSVQDVYKLHSIGKPFVKKHYKDALLHLESVGQITTKPSKRRIGTIADDVIVSFSRKENS